MTAEDQLFQRFGGEFAKGTVLFSEGEVGREMFVIQSGRVNITKKVREVERVLVTLGQGEFFGEMAIISNKPRSASAVVAEDARLLVIAPKTFEAMVRGNAEIALRMIKKLAERIADADAQIENLLLRDPQSRVVHYVAHLAESHGRSTDAGIALELPLDELPALLGVSSAELEDALAKMAKAGVCAPREGHHLIPTIVKLKEFLEFLEMKEKFAAID